MPAGLQAWRGRWGGEALNEQLAAFAGGTALGELPLLGALFAPPTDAAEQLVAELAAAVISHLSASVAPPLALQHAVDPQSATLVLLRSDSAILTVQALACGTYPAPSSIIFGPHQRHERIMRGAGQGTLFEAPGPLGALGRRVEPGPLRQRQVCVCAGDSRRFDGRSEAMIMRRVDTALLMLRLQRPAPGEGPSCMIDVQSGAVLRQAASRAEDTRIELAAAVLHAMDRTDAAPALAAAALGPGGTAARWQALRHCLALESATGLAALAQLAAQAGDPLRDPAVRLHRHLAGTLAAYAASGPCR